MRYARKLACFLALGGLVLGQDDKATFSTEVKYVIAPVTVTDSRGKMVTGLTPLDFRLYDNGKLQNITEDVASHPVSLAVAIQSNAAVEKILPQIQKSASLFDSLVLGEGGEMTVIGFDHRIQHLTQGFTSDPAKIKEAFMKLKPGSSSSRLNDAAMDGINQLRVRPKNFKRILMLISESRDGGSELHVRDVMDNADFSSVVIYSVDISHLLTSLTGKAEPNRPSSTANIPNRALPGGYVNTPTTESQNDMGNLMPLVKELYTATKAIFVKNPLEVFTKYSGGREYSFMTQHGLDQAISEIGEELHSQYLLTYSPTTLGEAGFHEIVVQVALQDLKVRTRNGYWYAGRPQ